MKNNEKFKIDGLTPNDIKILRECLANFQDEDFKKLPNFLPSLLDNKDYLQRFEKLIEKIFSEILKRIIKNISEESNSEYLNDFSKSIYAISKTVYR